MEQRSRRKTLARTQSLNKTLHICPSFVIRAHLVRTRLVLIISLQFLFRYLLSICVVVGSVAQRHVGALTSPSCPMGRCSASVVPKAAQCTTKTTSSNTVFQKSAR